MPAAETTGAEDRETEPRSTDRRTFLKGVAVVAGAASVAATFPSASRDAVVEELAEDHADDPALLIDLTRCVGCGRCVQACKLRNGLEWRSDQPATGPDAVLASSNWSVVRSVSIQTDGHTSLGPQRRTELGYVKTQCMHCLEPACASACFVAALRKSEAGPVVYDADRCIGCRYCMMACPFGVPTFDWESALGRIQKCDLCADRTSNGGATACAEACPSGTVTFGHRGELIAEAWRRIDSDDAYVRHVYGEHEVGGTSVLYISDVPFEALGFATTLPDVPLPEYTWKVTRLIPPVAATIVASLATLYVRRRRYLLDDEHAGISEAVEEVTT